jgi:hypothetical protein
MFRAVHDRLRSREFEVGIEPGNHRMIAITMDEPADIREPKLSVKIGVPATRDVEREMLVRLSDDVHVKAATAAPDIFGNAPERRQTASMSVRPTGTVIRGEPTDGLGHDFARGLLAKPIAAGFDKGYQYTRFDLTPLQVADRLI